jgi:hypothetical protein
MEKPQMTVDYEKQSFDKVEVNPYEIVIGVSKMARDINDRAHKYLNPSVEINPVSMALIRLDRNAVFRYETEEPAPPTEPEAS